MPLVIQNQNSEETTRENRIVASSRMTCAEDIRVMIVDDHPIVRLGIRAGLETLNGTIADCEAGDGASALALAVNRRPDVAILDSGMPDADGLEIAARLLELLPGLHVVLISNTFDLATLERGMLVGVHAFVLKTERPQQLAEMVRRTFRGEFCCSESLRQLLEPTLSGFRIVSAGRPSLAMLSPRERELLLILARGTTLKVAATSMGVTYKAADHLKQQLMKKLHVHDRVQLASFAFREGLIS